MSVSIRSQPSGCRTAIVAMSSNNSISSLFMRANAQDTCPEFGDAGGNRTRARAPGVPLSRSSAAETYGTPIKRAAFRPTPPAPEYESDRVPR